MDIQITPDELKLLMPPHDDVKYCYFASEDSHAFFWLDSSKDLHLRTVSINNGRLTVYNCTYSKDCANTLREYLDEYLCTKD